MLSNHKFILLKTRDKILKLRKNGRYISYCLNNSGIWQNELCNTIVIDNYIFLNLCQES